MNPFKRLLNRLGAVASMLLGDVRAFLRAAPLPLALFTLVLLLLPRLAVYLLLHSGASQAFRWRELITLLNRFLLLPAYAAACSLALHAAWNRASVRLKSCLDALRQQAGRLLLSGLCVVPALTILSNALQLLDDLLALLIGRIPLVGTGVRLLADLIALLIRLGFSVALPVGLVAAEMPLMGWSLWARPQAREACRLLWGGRTDLLPAFIALLLARLLLGGLLYLFGIIIPNDLFSPCVFVLEGLFDALCVLSAAALCLREHERQYGWTL